MATDAERLTAKRTALLAKCQAAREQRRRSELFAARQTVAAAEHARDLADQAVVEAAGARIDQLRERYDKLAHHQVASGDMKTLRAAEERLASEQAIQEQRLKLAEKQVQDAEAIVRQVARIYAQEAQLTRKREQMAERAQKIFLNKQSAEEETALEEELGDRLSTISRIA